MVATFARSQRSASRGSVTDETSLLKVGDLLAGKYRVARLLGEGGMGVVVEAHHQLLDQRVAVKLLYREIADAEAQSRLLAEARAAAKLQSEHVARVVDVDVGKDGLPFIVMELLEGADLCQLADARGALQPRLVADYMLQTLEGLAHAHGGGIIHRDLKPSNLFLANKADGSQIIKILDFGVSKSAPSPTDRHTQQLTGGRTMLGSPPYMSPEQVRSPKQVDHRTDIWSIGICMYELLTNAMPFGGSEMQETFAQILEKEPAPIHSLVPGVPEGLEAIVMKCLAKDRNARFSDVGELAAALAPFGSGAWTSYVERVQATLVRALLEDEVTSVELPRTPGSSTRIEIPGAPVRRTDSLQPELHGTASTVAGHFTVFDRKRPWLVVGMVIPALVGILLISYVALRPNAGVGIEELPSSRVELPAAAVEPPPRPAMPAVVAPPITVENSDPNPAKVVAPLASGTVRVVPVAALPPAPKAAPKAQPAAPAPAKTSSALPKELGSRE